MLTRIQQLRGYYPRQFWLLFSGNLVSTIGMSMIWPFMIIYVSEKLELPLTAVASLLTINSVMALAASFAAGWMADRIGRRGVMIAGMALHATVYLFFTRAESIGFFAVLMAVSGFVSPIYRVGVDAMVADLIPQEKRVDAYALLRMGNNVGVAIGPSIGGFLATQSYNIIFACAAIGLYLYSLLTILFVKETKPADCIGTAQPQERFGGYGKVLKDRIFMAICTGFTINTIGASLIFVLLAVYAKEQFGVPESQFGFIMATNAAMVILFQVFVTRVSKRFPTYRVMTLGAVFYTLGIGSVALGSGFIGFMASIIIMTCGELLLVPTTTTQVANLAPPEMRGRYMSIYGLSWGIASGIGPVFGGFLSDTFAPVSIWYGGALISLASVAVFALLALRQSRAVQPG